MGCGFGTHYLGFWVGYNPIHFTSKILNFRKQLENEREFLLSLYPFSRAHYQFVTDDFYKKQLFL
jgi:hypothetical protein